MRFVLLKAPDPGHHEETCKYKLMSSSMGCVIFHTPILLIGAADILGVVPVLFIIFTSCYLVTFSYIPWYCFILKLLVFTLTIVLEVNL